MYINPINAIYKDMEVRIAQELDERIVKAVSECVIDVDKDELIKALKYDRDQYIKGYNDALDKIRAEILEEKEWAYADFKQYKIDYLGVDAEYVEDELPQDDFRYGMERCVEIIDKYRAEKEKEQ